jgi:methylornithine synthase
MKMNGTINETLDQARKGKELTNEEIVQLLSVRDEQSLGLLFDTAKEVKERNFGNKVFMYGFVYFSTYCRNNCSFCFYRSSNIDSLRYRKTNAEIVSLATALEETGVHLIDLTMGEDPLMHNGQGYAPLLDIIRVVNQVVNVPIMVSPGVVPRNVFPEIAKAGADWFACYQETHNPQLFSTLRPKQDYRQRLMQKQWAKECGMLTEEGIMIGVGESITDRANSINIMKDIGVHQVRAMTFVPQCNTPMRAIKPTSQVEELVTLAVMRLVHQDKLIPASLDIEGLAGLQPRLDAGANVITSIIPPREGLAGVAQHELDIDAGNRSVEQIEEILRVLNIEKASNNDYNNFITKWRHRSERSEVAQ